MAKHKAGGDEEDSEAHKFWREENNHRDSHGLERCKRGYRRRLGKAWDRGKRQRQRQRPAELINRHQVKAHRRVAGPADNSLTCQHALLPVAGHMTSAHFEFPREVIPTTIPW